MKEIDVRGLSCPQPIIQLKKAIDTGEEEICVIADDAVARDNCVRMAEKNGFDVDLEEKEGDFRITAIKE